MANAVPAYESGPITYQVNQAVVGGQIVQLDTGGMVKPAVANSVIALGVATKDAIPTGTNQNPTVVGVPQSINLSPISAYTAVAMTGVWRLTNGGGGALALGDLVVCAASGAVQKYTAGTSTFDQIIGKCVDPAGIAAGQVGLILIDTV